MGSPPSPRALEGRVPAMASKSFAAGYLLIDTASGSFFPVLAHRIPALLAWQLLFLRRNEAAPVPFKRPRPVGGFRVPFSPSCSEVPQ